MDNKGKYQIITDNGVHFYDFNVSNILHIFYDSLNNNFLINQIENNETNCSLIFERGDDEEFNVFQITEKTFNDALLDALISFKIENYL